MKKLASGLVALSGRIENDPSFLSKWVCAAGNELVKGMAEVLHFEKFQDGILHLLVSNKAWFDQAGAMVPTLKHNINRLAGTSLVQQIEPHVNTRAFLMKKKHNISECDEPVPTPSDEVIAGASWIRNEKVREAFIKLGSKWEQLATKDER